jgi:isoamylase
MRGSRSGEGRQRRLSDRLRSACESGAVQAGRPLPWGAHRVGDGVNFSLFSRHATAVRLELYDHAGSGTPARTIVLDAAHHRTGDAWHVWVEGVRSGQLYAYRLEGPFQPEAGHRFNPHKLLLDPYARALAGVEQWDFAPAYGYDTTAAVADLSMSTEDDAGAMPKCVVMHEAFDWAGDRPPRHAWTDTVIYETHVRGATIHPSGGVAHPGTYLGLAEKIPYFTALGVTTLELMPVQEFNEWELRRLNPVTGEPLRNYWGYDPVAFLAPKESYAAQRAAGAQWLEFKQMVQAFHRAGLEVIMDIVLNHTAERNELGPTICFRGIANAIYYMLDERDPRFYKDYTGVGNTLNANHPVVRSFIIDVLRYWVTEMHVDGFRFDLASVLGRDEHGQMLPNPPLLEQIAEDPILRDVKLIAEAWDAGGGYQVGSFAERRWSEWNGRFRDDVRRFWRGDRGAAGAFASRLCGSADLYERSGKGPECSINFISCHDGFTLNDLVSYEHKHNEGNGENNRDGSDVNDSTNAGIEGPSDEATVEALRTRRIKNFLVALFAARGVPMLLGGDEFRRTQQGNNNAYCQDNEISWYDWTLLERHRDIHAFARGMIALRRRHAVLRAEAFYDADTIAWLAPDGAPRDWSDATLASVAFLVRGKAAPDLFLVFNPAPEAVTYALPQLQHGRAWHLAVDTFRPPPGDGHEPGREIRLEDQAAYRVGAVGSVILVGRGRTAQGDGE